MTSDPAVHEDSEGHPPDGRRLSVTALAAAICLIVAVALLVWRPPVALGFVGGAITGAGMLGVLVGAINRVVVPPQERRPHPAPWVALHVVKFALAAAFAYLVIVVLEGDVLAFAGGYTVALIAFLVALGRRGHDMRAGGPTWD